MENDDNVKLSLQEKVNELRKKIDKFKDEMHNKVGNESEDELNKSNKMLTK